MQKIEFKIILSIIIFTIFIVTLQRYQLSENIIEQFKEAKKVKNTLLIETIAPILSLNISLGLESSNNTYLDEIVKNNKDLESIILLDSDKNTLYSMHKNNEIETKKTDFTYSKQALVDLLTQENIGSIELIFSDKDYQNIISKNIEISRNIFLISFFLLAIFIFFIQREFRHLQELTKNVLEYDPKQNNYPMEKLSKNDEVSLIHNAIISMVQKIHTYSSELDEINAKLEEKVLQRTEELKVQKDKAEALVEVKSNFLANMSHEVRTPMNAIIGMSYILQKTDLDEQQHKHLSKIQKVSQSLLSIINDILDFSKLESGKFKIEYRAFSLETLIENIHNVFEYKIVEKGLQFRVEKPTKNFMYYGDSLRIEQILINLIANAVKFTEKGEILLKVECLSNKMIRFLVKDSGIGLTLEQQEKLFDAFTQVDASTTRKYGGTGLGLSIVKQLVEQMDGKVTVQSSLGKGSEFSFELQLLEQREEKSVDIQELKRNSLQSSKVISKHQVETTPQRISELFEKLYIKAKTKLPKEFEPILELLQKYKLSQKQMIQLEKIEKSYKKYDFKSIIEYMEKE
ncbi:hypothetical protein JHD47_07065 [Sulfurimonas sp. SAG-AH-194-L11]|nr:ATP-binding protein [Sulfurimonas sp. SAG-AH-194-L11]MDF1877576.1 hypothetical protein [Sulfurimonas sp. SAG-AH-194-L11]